MKKKWTIVLIMMLIVSFIGVSQAVENIPSSQKSFSNKQTTLSGFTHTVFAEYAATTWCPNCPIAAAAIYKVDAEESNPFSYVTLVVDTNPNARNRSWFGYFNMVIPSVYFDGGFKYIIGREETVNETADAYFDLIEEIGMRTDIKNIDLETAVSWEGNAEMSIAVTVTNNEDSFYLGFIKSYVTEIESRWIDYSGSPYHYAFLDFAINNFIFLKPHETKTITVQWDGKENHDGLTFEDISQDNILVQSAVFQWIPHLTKGYDELPQYTQRYLGFYLDQADGAIPE